MFVKKITLVNLKKIENLTHEFNKAVYLITGKNKKGKSTIISAINSALNGRRSDNLLTTGKDKGYYIIEVGDENSTQYEVKCSFNENNGRGSLTIKSVKDGMVSKNISSLQAIFKYNDFDVSEFVSWSKTADGRKKQVEIIRDLLSKEENDKISQIDNDYQTIYEERASVNLLIKNYEEITKVDDCKSDELEIYKEKKNIENLLTKKSKALEHNTKFKQAENLRDEINKVLDNFDDETQKSKDEIKEEILNYQEMVTNLQNEIEKKQKELETRSNEMKAKELKLKNYDEKRDSEKETIEQRKKNSLDYFKKNSLIDIKEIDQEIKDSNEWNIKHEKAKEYFSNLIKLAEEKLKSEEKTKKLNDLKQEKKEVISKSKLPIEGLSFNENGLIYNGIPFNEIDTATSEQMEIATRILIAKNPHTKVFKIMQGESLDEDNLKAIIEFAKKEGYQGFIEQVERGQDELIIEEYNEK